jgi:GTP-binding protein
MKTVTAEFIKSATTPSQYPETGLPEVAFAGRSNVGKSSLINRLVHRKNLARTSNTPGRTQLINFFLIRNFCQFVDLPGYGYAKVPDSVKRTWGPMIESYLRESKNLRLVTMIMDIRRDPGQDDFALIGWLKHYEIPVILVLTKIDKLSKNKCRNRYKLIRDALGMPADSEPVLFSSVTGEGRDILWREIEKACK